jgi:hypothetical protein
MKDISKSSLKDGILVLFGLVNMTIIIYLSFGFADQLQEQSGYPENPDKSIIEL